MRSTCAGLATPNWGVAAVPIASKPSSNNTIGSKRGGEEGEKKTKRKETNKQRKASTSISQHAELESHLTRDMWRTLFVSVV